jgi:hypothetical protein
LIFTIRIAQVNAVRFCSTHLKTLSTSPTGGPPATVVVASGMETAVGATSGRGCRLVLEKSVGRTGPTSVHK